MEKKSLSLKLIKKMFNFPTQFCLGSINHGFDATESKEVSLKGNVSNFLVDYNTSEKSDILNIQKYLMVLNNIKRCSGHLVDY